MADGQSRLSGVPGQVTGPGASAVKYDILTALLVTATNGAPVPARLALRLSLLITARFNWRRGTFTVGQVEMARLWGVTERTAKREVAELRARGWIEVAVPAARGRVAEHRIRFDAILAQSRAHWEAVGPDFVARMSPAPERPSAEIVPLRIATSHPVPTGEDDTGWTTLAARLAEEDAATYGAWMAGLTPVALEAGVLTLIAPSRFVATYVTTHHKARLIWMAQRDGMALRDIRVLPPDGA